MCQHPLKVRVFLGSMLPQYMALSVVCFVRQKKNMCVRSLGYIVGALGELRPFL